MKYVLFWIKSARGTEEYTVRKVSSFTDEDDIKEMLETWCSKFGAWEKEGSMINYGWKYIKLLKRKDLLKQWEKICARYHRANTQRKIMVAKLNPS